MDNIIRLFFSILVIFLKEKDKFRTVFSSPISNIFPIIALDYGPGDEVTTSQDILFNLFSYR